MSDCTSNSKIIYKDDKVTVILSHYSLLAKNIKINRINSATATKAAATYVIAAAFNTFLVSRSSLFLIIPVDTNLLIARFDASNSTGGVTNWKRTAADIKMIPNKNKFAIFNRIPAKIKKNDKLEPNDATGTNAVRNFKNA